MGGVLLTIATGWRGVEPYEETQEMKDSITQEHGKGVGCVIVIVEI
jgi:hypothetical protein